VKRYPAQRRPGFSKRGHDPVPRPRAKFAIAASHHDNALMSKQTAWTRDQQLIALRLYMATPFGKLHGRNAEIIALAAHMNRTPNAVAMKACNFASLDPEFLKTNRKGLSGASESDRALWQEFSGDSEAIAAEAEEAFARFAPAQAAIDQPDIRTPPGETDTLRLIRARRVQSFFRAAVLTSYQNRCAISGLAIPELLVASHIIPWSESVERRADPTNGICLNALFDRAFDRGLLTLDQDLRVALSQNLRDIIASTELKCSLQEAEGRRLQVPNRFHPSSEGLAFHREHIFQP